MKITAFLGSPRKNGNTELLLKEAIRGIEDEGQSVEVFNLNSMKFLPCQNCGGCDETGKCVINDEMQAIYEAIKTSDRIILASPVFFSGLSAQAKAMIDRCQCIWCEKYLLKRPVPEGPFKRKALLLLVGGQKEPSGIKCAEVSAVAFFRTINVSSHVTLSYTGIDRKGEILERKDALKEAYEAGKKLVEV
ncbi:MAG: flavodoxin family protein [Nitrospirae bacterium]|nr:flavodoxin family protein [Nitrospirota bacterium]